MKSNNTLTLFNTHITFIISYDITTPIITYVINDINTLSYVIINTTFHLYKALLMHINTTPPCVISTQRTDPRSASTQHCATQHIIPSLYQIVMLQLGTLILNNYLGWDSCLHLSLWSFCCPSHKRPSSYPLTLSSSPPFTLSLFDTLRYTSHI